MNVTLTNLGSISVPFSSTDDKGFATTLEPNEPKGFNLPSVSVASVGDNPSFREELGDALKGLVEILVGLITFWRSKQLDDDEEPVVHVSIENHGPNGLRVLLGSNTSEVWVDVGTTYAAEALEYVEIRELGV